MQSTSTNGSGWQSAPWRIAAWLAAAVIMLVPITIHLASDNFGWSRGDFVFVAVILATGGSIFDIAARRAPNLFYLAGVGAALAAGFGLVVVNGAVGLVGSEDHARNLLFLIVILVAIIGTALARGRPEGMARTMFAAAITHTLISFGLLIAARGVSDGDPLMEVVGLAFFAAIWLASSWLFRSAGR